MQSTSVSIATVFSAVSTAIRVPISAGIFVSNVVLFALMTKFASLGSKGSHAISPTAFATGYILKMAGVPGVYPFWSFFGWFQYWGLTFPGWVVQHHLLGGPNLRDCVVTRHLAFDSVLTEEIEKNRVGLVIEVASGFSGRGTRFAAKCPHVTYVESDLRPMTEYRKQLRPAKQSNLYIIPLNVLLTSVTDRESLLGPDVDAVIEEAKARWIASGRTTEMGVAVVAEGLLSYLSKDEKATFFAAARALISRVGRGVLVLEVFATIRERMANPPFPISAVGGLLRNVGFATVWNRARSDMQKINHDDGIVSDLVRSGFSKTSHMFLAADYLKEAGQGDLSLSAANTGWLDVVVARIEEDRLD